MPQSIKEYMEEHYKITGLTEKDGKDLEKMFSVESFGKDEVVFRENESGDKMYFVINGLVKISLKDIDNGKTIALMKPGAVIGEITFFDRRPHSADAVAIANTEMFVLNLDSFNEVKKSNPGLALKITDVILRTVTERLRGTTRKMYGLY